MTEFELDPKAPLRAGATVSVDAELPMIVWLRGDEPYAGAFRLEAEQVMEQLGIRRSRLTQIAGKELRVGRMRRGRYVSPVFRQEDVDAYLSWTRATASHLKSSTVLQDAACELREQGHLLARKLAEVPATLALDVARTVGRGVVDISRLISEDHASAQLSFQRLQCEILEVESRLKQGLAVLSDKIKSLENQVLQQGPSLVLTVQSLTELTALVRLLRVDQSQLEANFIHSQADLASRLTEILRLVEQQRARQRKSSPSRAAARRLRRLEGFLPAKKPRIRQLPRRRQPLS